MAADSRFDAAEAELDRGEPWRYREDNAPNPLTIEVEGWVNGHTKHGDAEFLVGADRDGNKWSVLVGPTVLRRRLIDGEVSEWDDERETYVVVDMQGRVQAGDVVSMKYLGDRDNGSGGSYANFDVVRKPAANGTKPEARDEPKLEATPEPGPEPSTGFGFDDDIPY
jgi:hypothetical protein